jgi:arabinoxylan arabinofuranohydrolase
MAPYPGGFTSPARVLTAPATQFGSTDTNNHHAMFEFRGETYITYHTQLVSMAMGVYPELSNRRLRSAFIDRMPVNPDGTIPPITMTRSGVEQISYLNPFIENEAETIAVQGGVYTRPATGASNGMLVTSIDTGDWLGIYGVDFGSVGAKRFTARVRTPDMQDYVGAIELRLNPQAAGETRDIINLSPTVTTRITGGEVIGVAVIQALPGEEGKFAKVSINLDKTVTGVHDLVFVFYSSLGIRPETVLPDSRHKDGFEFDTWQFFSD